MWRGLGVWRVLAEMGFEIVSEYEGDALTLILSLSLWERE